MTTPDPAEMRATISDLDAAHDWLLTWAMAADPDVVTHYWHLCDSEGDSCGCRLQGEDDPR